MFKQIASLSAVLVLAIAPAFAQAHIAKGSRVFIEPTPDNFQTYLQAAFTAKKVPLTVTDDKAKADFILTSTSDLQKAGWAKTIFVSPKADADASISIKDAHTGDVVFGYAVDKFSARHAQQSTAEACAKHIRQFMEKE